MNNDHAMAIVCDLALCIGREVTLDALLTKVLQRFMHHCATPVGAVLQQQREGYKLLKVIGDEQLRQHTGTTLTLPGWVSEEEHCLLQQTLPLPGSRPYQFAYRLKVEGGYLILLLAPSHISRSYRSAICSARCSATWPAPFPSARTASCSPCVSRPN